MLRDEIKFRHALDELIINSQEVKPFLRDTVKAKDTRKRKALGDNWANFAFFCKTYFPQAITKDFCACHRDMFMRTQKNVGGITAITGFRGLAKTTIMGVMYSVWQLAKGEKFIIHVSADVELAEESTTAIYHNLAYNRRIASDFPQLRISEGTEDDFYTADKARVRARSIKQTIKKSINPKRSVRP